MAAALRQTLTETAVYVRYHYATERLYCPRAIEEALARIDALQEAADDHAAHLLVAPTLALRPLLPGSVSDSLAALFATLATQAGENDAI